MSRFADVFAACRAAGRKALITFATAGAPDMETSEKTMAAASRKQMSRCFLTIEIPPHVRQRSSRDPRK